MVSADDFLADAGDTCARSSSRLDLGDWSVPSSTDFVPAAITAITASGEDDSWSIGCRLSKWRGDWRMWMVLVISVWMPVGEIVCECQIHGKQSKLKDEIRELDSSGCLGALRVERKLDACLKYFRKLWKLCRIAYSVLPITPITWFTHSLSSRTDWNIRLLLKQLVSTFLNSWASNHPFLKVFFSALVIWYLTTLWFYSTRDWNGVLDGCCSISTALQ